jgi:hypothetical protein
MAYFPIPRHSTIGCRIMGAMFKGTYSFGTQQEASVFPSRDSKLLAQSMVFSIKDIM